MNQRDRKIVIHTVSIAAKAAALAIPQSIIQFFLQEGVDGITETVLNVPADFPTVEIALQDSTEMVRIAVLDILASLDDTDELISDFHELSIHMADKLVKEQLGRDRGYSCDELSQISQALSLYVRKVREWAIQKPDVMRQIIEGLGSEMYRLKNNVTELNICVRDHEIRIDEIEKNSHPNIVTQPLPILDLRSLECYKSESSEFYRYFVADSSIGINDFFLLDNYRMLTLTVDYPLLSSYNRNLESNIKDLQEVRNILQNQGILFITGMYGTGKTALMKKLHFELSQNTENLVCYFQANSVIQFINEIWMNTSEQIVKAIGIKTVIQKELEKCFDGLFSSGTQVYIFIDELEELNIVLDKNTAYLDVFFSCVCSYQERHSNYFFILASRKYAQIDERKEICVADTLFYEYCCVYDGRRTSFAFVQTQLFSVEARDEWIEEYASRNNKSITFTEIKKTYGKIVNAMNTPIFLFAFMRKYVSNINSQVVEGYYYYYSKFIDETISGRFGLGQHSNLIETKNFTESGYRNILRQIAFNILKNSEKYLNTKIYKEYIVEEQPLLADELTERKFEILLSDLEEFMQPTEYEKASLINCYFFNMDNRRICFTDTNILFALAAEYIFESICFLAQKNNMEFQVDHLNQIKLVRLYPHLADYIIYLLKTSKHNEEIIAYITSFVKHPDIRSHHLNMSEQNAGFVERILLLYILFIKTNKKTYNNPEYSHMFKEMLYYVNAYKTKFYISSKKEYAYTIERYCMGLNLHYLELKRVNLKNFNFQSCNITSKCKFIQCKFCYTNFFDVTMDDVKFELCEIKNIGKFSLKWPKGAHGKYQVTFDNCRIRDCQFVLKAVRFCNCKINGLKLDVTEDRVVVFENCHIGKLSIDVNSRSTSHRPVFTNCIFGKDKLPSIRGFSAEEVKDMIRMNGK